MEQVSFRVMAAKMATLLLTVYCSLEAWLEISPDIKPPPLPPSLGPVKYDNETVLELGWEVCHTLLLSAVRVTCCLLLILLSPVTPATPFLKTLQ